MVKKNISVKIFGIELKTPLVTASGTFGYGYESRDLADYDSIGAVVTKTITLKQKSGNPPPRLAEVEAGMLNTIGLQNVGLDRFLDEKWPKLANLSAPVFVSVAGETPEDYIKMARAVSDKCSAAAIELNLSCPNLRKQIICQNNELVSQIVKGVREATKLPVIAKISPMVSDIAALAVLCEESGAGAVSLVNTFPGMAININTRKPKLSTITGGMSGPAIKPLALRCVYAASKAVKIPVIGGGGVVTGDDAVEFILAGATLVSVGTALFKDVNAIKDIASGIEAYVKKNNIASLSAITGNLSQ